MTQPTAERLAWTIWVLSLLLVGLFVVFYALTPPAPLPIYLRLGWWERLHPLASLAFSTVGALIVTRRPGNRIGWVACAIGLTGSIEAFAQAYATYSAYGRVVPLPAAAWMAWLRQWIWQVPFVLTAAVLALLYPDGRLLSARWRFVGWLAAAAIALAPLPGFWADGFVQYRVRDPLAADLHVPEQFLNVSSVLGFIAMVFAAWSLIIRFSMARGDERQQVKWFASATALIVLVLVAGGLGQAFGIVSISAYRAPVIDLLGPLAFICLPIAIGIAILKYRLYDIDIVINRSLVFGSLALFITAVYVGIVAGIGALVGSANHPNIALSILATAVVAVAFQPVRERVERWANRLVYGKRATPYEVLAQFSDRVAGTFASEEILPRMAQVLADGTAAARTDVWLRLGDHIESAASWPSDASPAPGSLPLNGQLLPAVPGVTRVVPVRHQGELLGALSVNKRPGEALTPVEEGLLKDVAAQAGLVLRNVRLTADLRVRLDQISQQARELQASRQRIVAAQDEERRNLERNIHDGAQQHLVALTVKLRLAAAQAKRDPGGALETVRALDVETDEALGTLRELARGIYPPILREHGLTRALQAQITRMDVPAEIQDGGVGRYAPEAEAAVYFSCLEALQNASKHSNARRIRLILEQHDRTLIFSVTDDGKGFDPRAVGRGSGMQNMADRMEALGGTLTVSAAVGGGTTVSGRVPASTLELAT